jgi:hypothetical protein
LGPAIASSQSKQVRNYQLASGSGLPKCMASHNEDISIHESKSAEHLDHMWIVLDLLRITSLKLKYQNAYGFMMRLKILNFASSKDECILRIQ